MPFSTREKRIAYGKLLWRRFRAAGGCGQCGEPITRFSRCLRHREAIAAAHARRVQARNAK